MSTHAVNVDASFIPSSTLQCCVVCHRPNVQKMDANTLQAFPVYLTPKECRIIVLLCTGLCNKEIAQRMDTSEQVVKNALRFLYRKAAVRDRAALLIRMFKFKYEGV